MERDKLIKRIRYHWYSYVARGGYSSPSPKVGKLERGGIEHWTHFLQLGRKYAQAYKGKWNALSKFLPMGVVMLLTGETRHDYYRRKRTSYMAIC